MYKVSIVYQQLNLPFLNTEIVPCDIVNTICPILTDPKLMLQLLYNFNKKDNILPRINTEISQILINYFSCIHLKKDPQSLEYLKHLPLFLTYKSKCTSLNGKTVYEWPYGMCTAGEIIWLRSRSDVVFLDGSGAWSKLRSELGVYSIHQIEMYTKYIFQHFCTMNESVRLKHLQYIRDYLFQDAKIHKTEWEYPQFLQELCNLRCIGSDGSQLRAIEKFHDFKNKIFKTFEDKYFFLPDCFRASEKLPKEATREQRDKADRYYVEWRDFFEELGMHCKVTSDEFLELCHEVANGQHVINTKAKSRVLFEHLFKNDTQEWFSKSFASKVVEISFVLADEGEHYTWIAPVKRQGTCVIQTDGNPVWLTKLNGACIYDDVSLVWTVKPVYRTPCLYWQPSTVLSTYLKLKHYRATVSDVVQNLVNISESGHGQMANPALFDRYTAPCPGKYDIGLVDVIAKCFEFLNKETITPYHLDILKMTPCIPVPASNDKTVLVKPSQALTTDVSIFFPYLHTVPYQLMTYIKLLERIGVKTSITLCHFQLVLRLLHDNILNEKMDPNSVDMVCHVINNLKIHVHDDEQAGKELSPLYLPGQDNCLHLSLDLVYPDTYNYKLCQLPQSNTDFCLLHHPNPHGNLDQFDFANSFCNRLPKAVRPKPLSQLCFQKLSLECSSLSHHEDIDMASHLKTALKLNMLPIACKSMLLKDVSDSRHRLESLEERLSTLFQRVEVITIQNLQVDILLKSGESKIGSAKVDYFLYQECNEIGSNFCLYLDSRVGRMEEEHIHKTMAKELLVAVSKIVTIAFSGGIPDKLHEAFRLFLKSQTDADVRKACQMHGINIMEDADFVQALDPKIGKEIPEAWHYKLDQNPYNIFHPQELVGYESANGCYIFAQVLYTIHQDDSEQGGTDTLLTKYMISVLDHEHIVTALDIYKFVTQSRDNRALPYSEEVVEEEESTVENAAEAKRRLWEQLRQIWSLSEPEKSKAIRRLYLKWHPDKNLDNVTLANDVFQFLVKQIERLNQGLDLDEDYVVASSSDVESPSSPWKESFSTWEQTAKSHKRHRNHHSEYFEARGGVAEHVPFYQPKPDPIEGARWVTQAGMDFKALEALYKGATEDSDISSHVCFMAHEVAEKALKGGVYAACGLDGQYLTNHEIQLHANMLRGEKLHLASELPSLASPLARYYLDTRFPNRWGARVVPSKQYSITDAEQAREKARNILEIACNIVKECAT